MKFAGEVYKCKLIVLLSILLLFSSVPNHQAYAQIALNSKYAVGIDAQSGEVLFEKNAFETAYPASMTKVLTAMLLMEHVEEGEEITFSANAVNQVRSRSPLYFYEGETIKRDDALMALIVVSANDVATAIAEHIAGTEALFGDMMTQKAHELGATQSQFKTPNGLHHPEHYTTAYDMALITREAIKNDRILEALGTKSVKVSTSRQSMVITNPSRIHDDPDSLGGKTGFTTPAGNTLVKIDERDGKTVINVIMKSNIAYIYDEIKSISQFSMSQLEKVPVIDENKWTKTMMLHDKPVLVGPKRSVYLNRKINTNPYTLHFKQTESFTLNELILNGLQKGQKVGELTIMRGEDAVETVDVMTLHHSIYEEKEEEQSYVYVWFMLALTLFGTPFTYFGSVQLRKRHRLMKRKKKIKQPIYEMNKY
ncbi:D-alanyl-D-alanine carboxypeptidase family protein [Caldalkalibacillus salinus]|uniref:D-alanyl-D-alanine carboxypeptidase family protein n=1 Tax=Caldalkalibacillus salinus TaxID=2803787 RepID=UPI001920FE72|nr:D-alanyl-D-alanine carboxypeptidase family protein [Caldalkalibacillus salinus]